MARPRPRCDDPPGSVVNSQGGSVQHNRRPSRALARRAFLLAVLLVAAGAVTGSIARAAAAVPLTGENLSTVQPGTSSNASCMPQGTSGFDFQAAGTATGPYPGTFTEHGSVQLGPLTNVGATNFGF